METHRLASLLLIGLCPHLTLAQPGHPAGAPLTACGWRDVDPEDVPWGRWRTPQTHGRPVFLISHPPQYRATRVVQGEKHWPGPRGTAGRAQVCRCWVETQAAIREQGGRKIQKVKKTQELKARGLRSVYLYGGEAKESNSVQ